jgi:1,2-diacylglycerol 3-alpha-glucosyltransferase
MKRRERTHEPPLRIAMVAACPFPSLRGSQVLIRELAQALADRGHAVHLVTYPFGESLVPIRGILVHRVAPPYVAASGGGRFGWRRLALDASVMAMLYRVVRRERIQVIHAHNYEGQLIGYAIRRLTGVPVVYHSHNALSDELDYYFKSAWYRAVARVVGRVLDRQIPRRADFSIALTPELESFLRAHGVAAHQLAVIPPGLTPAGGGDCHAGEADAFSGRFVVMYAGNLDPYQDLDVLFRGFAAAREDIERALLVVVTHEERWATRVTAPLQALLRNGHARVIVAPAYAVVRRLLARADVLVCPRSSWSGFPIKLLNYMAAGRPVVVAEGSAKGIGDGETGLVFRNGDADGLAATLRRLSADAALRQRLGDNARARADAYGWKRIVSQVEQVYAAVRRPPIAEPRRDALPARPRSLMALPRDRISATSKGRPE